MTGEEGTAPEQAGSAEVTGHQRDTVLITGASSGIGLELARLFAGDGADLVLVARSEDKLRELAGELTAEHGIAAQVLAADLTRPDSAGEIAEALARQGVQVDVLVNNAGFGAHGQVAGIGVQRQLDVIEVNVAALTRLTALFLPGMLERGHGAVLNVASTAAFQPGPNQAVYCATKAYVLSFTEALAEEVRGSGVRVSCLAPGATETQFAAQAGMTGTLAFRMGAMTPGPVARAGHDGLRRGKALVIPGLLNRAMALSVRLAPRALVTRIAGRMQA
jgi:short-subunit dehydrogenase